MREKIVKYVSDWEKRCYSNGIPDEIPIRLHQLNKAPSYKAIVSAIFKNDIALESLGFSKKKCKEYHELKRVELSQRDTKSNQLKLF